MMPRTITLDDDDLRLLVGVLDRAGSNTLSQSKRERCEAMIRRIADALCPGPMIHPSVTLEAHDETTLWNDSEKLEIICGWLWGRAQGERGAELLGSFQEFVQVRAAEAREVGLEDAA
jgi:hypothetical protein